MNINKVTILEQSWRQSETQMQSTNTDYKPLDAGFRVQIVATNSLETAFSATICNQKHTLETRFSTANCRPLLETLFSIVNFVHWRHFLIENSVSINGFLNRVRRF